MKKISIKFLLKVIVLAILMLIVNKANVVLASNEGRSNNQFCYLSDIKYIPSQSSVGWGSITLDKNLDSKFNKGLITLNVEGEKRQFLKGIAAHATSTVVYDIGEYNYDFFTSYIGVDESRGNAGNGVKFAIYTSIDGENWDLKTPASPQVMKGSSNAQFVKIDIKGAKYLKLYAHNNGNADGDHSVYANAKLIKEGYEESDNKPVDFIKTVEEYDEIIKTYDGQEISGDYELAILQREFVKNVEYDLLQLFVSLGDKYEETISWLFNDVSNLRLYILGGAPEGGSYYNSLTELSRLYHEYKEDFTNTEKLNNTWEPNLTYGELYKKMAISLSLTHSQNVGLWMQSGAEENKSDALRRYAIYKYIHKNGKFRVNEKIDYTPWFESLNVEEMRFIMNNAIDDEEILWLNEYVQSKIVTTGNSNWITPHPHIAYVWPNYGNPVYYAEENKDYFNELFSVNGVGLFDLRYTIPGGKNIPNYTISVTRGTADYKLYKVWMNFRNKFGTGCVCGGISKSGSNIRTTHGIPATVIGQPGHAALLYYSKDAQGRGYWNIDNDVSGWTLSEKSERMLLGWGNASYSRGYSVVYMALAQEVLNDYENFEKCEKMVKLANSYESNLEKQEEIYRKALEIQPINIDAWYGLINVYNKNENKTEDQYFELAKELAENLKYFPLPMQHLTNLIKPKLTSIENSYKFTLLQTRILTEGAATPNNTAESYTVYQPSLTRLEANYLLGKLDKTIATFSFDGEDAGKIVLSERFNGNGVRWDYAITRKKDGEGNDTAEKIWKEVSFTAEEEHKWQLTPEEIASITAENDIYVHIVGVNYDEENLYKIDIQESNLGSNLYANDWENKLIGATGTMQWKLNEADEWTTYSEEEPDLTGDKTLIVRMGATGVYLASKTSVTYNFTTNNEPDTRKYIPISHLSVNAVSTEATAQKRFATNTIDGNINTSWHSAWNGSDTDKFIVIKLDEAKSLSGLDYIPAPGGNGKILSAQILLSRDGENWDEVVSGTDWTYANSNDTTMKSIDFEPAKVQYIKIVGKRTQSASSSQSFMTAAMFNLYEDTTLKTLANFSFNGENAGEIILEDEFKGSNWKYSIDSGNTWKNVNEDSCKLTDEELNKINENDKIKILVDGNSKEYIINIKEGTVPERAYLNDLENRPIGLANIENLEWKYADDSNWISYQEQEPLATGNKLLLVRRKAKGIHTASQAIEYQFTDDNQPETEKYIPIKHLSVTDCSSESPDRGEPKEYAIDGNINTMWHTSHTATDDPRFIVIKLDEPRYISKLQYAVKTGYAYGVIKDAVISTSMDGENWEEAVVVKDLYNPSDKDELISTEGIKDILFGEAKEALYIKLQCTKSCDYVNGSKDGVPYDYFLAATMINLFEDATKRPEEPDNPENPDNPDNPGKPDNPGTDIEQGELFFKSKYNTVKKDENSYLYKINPQTELVDFIANCETNENATITMYKQNGEELGEDEIVGTGMVLVIKLDEEEIRLTISVIGDTDGNGEVTPTDLADAIQKALGEDNLNVEQILAVDVDNNGEVTPTDLAEMIKLTLE